MTYLEQSGDFDKSDTLQIVGQVCISVVIVSYTGVFIAAYTVFAKILYRKAFSDLSMKVKINLSLYLVHGACSLLFEIFLLVSAAIGGADYASVFIAKRWRSFIALNFTIWLCLHWSFTASYLQTACLFRKIFQAKSDEDFTAVRKRKLSLLILELTVHCIFLCIMSYLIVTDLSQMHEYWLYFWFGFNNATLIIMPVVGKLSARHINKNSRSIERLGISTNSRVMKVYLALWITLAILCTTDGVMIIQFWKQLD